MKSGDMIHYGKYDYLNKYPYENQILILLYPQSITFAIVSRCFENKKNNNCCKTKMPLVYIKKVNNSYCFYFQTFGYNGKCDGLWVW